MDFWGGCAVPEDVLGRVYMQGCITFAVEGRITVVWPGCLRQGVRRASGRRGRGGGMQGAVMVLVPDDFGQRGAGARADVRGTGLRLGNAEYLVAGL